MNWDSMDRGTSPCRIAVIGGGITGLAAAFRLKELANEQGVSTDVTVLERGPRLGGAVGSLRMGEYLIDIGADSFLTNKPAAVKLCQRLGIEDRLIPTDPRYRGAHVLHDGRPVRVPEGFQLLSPTALWPILTSPLFSTWGKLRLLMEWYVPPRIIAKNAATQIGTGEWKDSLSNDHLVDESLADFVRRRFGREAFDYLVQPLVGGIYTADPESLSLAATMPRFLEMERDHGSLIRASMCAGSSKNANVIDPTQQNKSPGDKSSGARYGLFAGLKGGMTDLVDTLRSQVGSACTVRLNCPVTCVRKSNIDSGRARSFCSVSSTELNSADTNVTCNDSDYVLEFENGQREHFDAVIIAATAERTAALIESLNFELSCELRQIPYASTAIVVSGHQLGDIRHPLDSFGLVVPHVERRRILAVSFSSRKFPDRAPEGRVLLRTFLGGALQPEILEQSDDELIHTTRSELADIFGVRGEPDFIRVWRHERAMAQYHVGHLDRVARIDELLQQAPGLALAGNAYRGVGLPDVIASGERAAESVFRAVTASRD